ncbi:hypothetical protein BX600DRAFT_536971, partial [Xylariales sp. PMI_506]
SCSICQIRKVKCDRKPSGCSQCNKYQWACPGYPPIRAKRRIRQPKSENVKRGTELHKRNVGFISPIFEDGFHSASCPSREESPSLSQRVNHRSSLFISSPPTIQPGLSVSSIALQLAGHLSSKPFAGFSLCEIGSFIWLVIPRLGISDALDDAVKCLCDGWVAFISSRTANPDVYYRKALRSLQRSLNDSSESLSAETLCASICLSWFEMLTNKSSLSWLVHSTGSAKLIQLRGPNQHLEGFGRALLHAEHGLIASQALMDRKPCFLCEPAWTGMIHMPLPDPNPEWQTKLTVNHFQRVDRLSLLRKQVDELVETGDYTYHRIIQLVHGLERLRCEIGNDLPKTSTSLDHPQPMKASLTNSPNPILLCKDALAYISVDLLILELYRVLVLACSSVSWLNDCLSNLLSIFRIRRISQIGNAKTSINFETDLNIEMDEIFQLVCATYNEARVVTPLHCLRLTSIYFTMYERFQNDNKPLHSIWFKIINLFGKVPANIDSE